MCAAKLTRRCLGASGPYLLPPILPSQQTGFRRPRTVDRREFPKKCTERVAPPPQTGPSGSRTSAGYAAGGRNACARWMPDRHYRPIRFVSRDFPLPRSPETKCQLKKWAVPETGTRYRLRSSAWARPTGDVQIRSAQDCRSAETSTCAPPVAPRNNFVAAWMGIRPLEACRGTREASRVGRFHLKLAAKRDAG